MSTTTIRIAVAVDTEGGWFAEGHNDEGNESKVRGATDAMGHDAVAVYWVEVELPLPQIRVVPGAVIGGQGVPTTKQEGE